MERELPQGWLASALSPGLSVLVPRPQNIQVEACLPGADPRELGCLRLVLTLAEPGHCKVCNVPGLPHMTHRSCNFKELSVKS